MSIQNLHKAEFQLVYKKLALTKKTCFVSEQKTARR